MQEIDRLRSLGFGSGSDLYDPPSSSERAAFTALVNRMARRRGLTAAQAR